jgi:hypothetical protein
MKRPESPELDALQMRDLEDFLSHRPPTQLKKDLHQLTEDSQSDRGPYASGGTPANVSKTYILIQEALEQSTKKK